jgi:hypothetical protein
VTLALATPAVAVLGVTGVLVNTSPPLTVSVKVTVPVTGVVAESIAWTVTT